MRSALLLAFAIAVVQAQSAPDNLRVEYLDSPTGVDVPRPTFTWRIPLVRAFSLKVFRSKYRYDTHISLQMDGDAGRLFPQQYQSGYRVTVWLTANRSSVYDSGVLSGTNPLHLPQQDLNLQSDTAYSWQVCGRRRLWHSPAI